MMMSKTFNYLIQNTPYERDIASGESIEGNVTFPSIEIIDDTIMQAMINIINLARKYRQIEIDQTPYLCRGKKLHDTGIALSEAITKYDILLIKKKDG